VIESVLFLDIDGVVSPFKGQTSPGKVQLVTEASLFPPERIKLLNQIVLATDCEIVISSTWRLNHTLIWFEEMMVAAGFIGKLLSVTPHRPGKPRGQEIAAWLAAHKTEHFVILDDLYQQGPKEEMGHLLPFLVRTQHDVGLTEEDAEKAIKILRGEQ
jgi:hypothetical protein